MNFFLNQLTRSIGVFIRTFRAYFRRRIVGAVARVRRLTNLSRNATKAASSSLQGVMSAAQKPTQPSDYVETGRLFISKALIIRVLLLLVALFLLVYFVIWPFILSRFLTARFYEEDKRVKEWSGRVIVYSDKKKTLPLFSGRLEDGVLQGECKQYDREGVLLYEGQLRDGVRTGSGKEYVDGILVYDGVFDSGLYSGHGKRYEDGQLVYDGQYDAGMRSGSGTAYEDGSLLYKGQFMDDLYEGRGKLYQNGALRYDGGFHAGAKEGTGVVYEDGRVLYEGQFLNDLYEGRGKLYANGVLRYDGSFHAGVPDGTGTAYYASGRMAYQGSYLAGKPDGVGTEYREDGRKSYDGGFAEGVYSGTGTLFYPDGSQLEAVFQNGEAEGTVGWKKNGLLYYQGEWAENGPSGFGTIYSQSGKKLYEGPFLGGTIDGRKLLSFTADDLRAAFCDSTVRSERIGDGFRIMAEELGLTALCTFQTEGEDSTVYQIYLAAPVKGDWVTLMPGMEHVQAVRWPEDAEPKQRVFRYIGQYGVNVEAGAYFAENAVSDARRTTALYEDESMEKVVLLTWVRTDVVPFPLDWDDGSSGDGSVEAFLDALDQMEETAGSDVGGGAPFGTEDPEAAFAGIAGAAEAVELTDAMLRYWELTEQMNALTEAYERLGILLEDTRDQVSKGLASMDSASALEQEQTELASRIEACQTELKRVELTALEAGADDLGKFALGEMLVDFDPSGQEVGELSLIAAAYAQATGSDADAAAVQKAVKEGLLDLMDAYGKVKLALSRYQALGANTKSEASSYAMGLGSKEAWYRAMNAQTLGRIEICEALADFSSLANSFNQLTGGWVSRTFDWHRAVFEPVFQAEMLPVEVFAREAEEAAAEALEASEAAKTAAEAALAAVERASKAAEAEPVAAEAAQAAAKAAAVAVEKAAEAAAAAAEAASAAADTAAAATPLEAVQIIPRAKTAAVAAAAAAAEAAEAQVTAEAEAQRAEELGASAAAEREAKEAAAAAAESEME